MELRRFKPYIIVSIIFWVSLLVMNYFFLLILNFRYVGIVIWIFLYIIILLIIYASSNSEFNSRKRKKSYDQKAIKISCAIFTTIFVLILIVYWLISAKMFNANSYQQLITVDETGEFIDDFELVDINELPIVDQAYAMRMGDKVMGEKFTNQEGLELNYGSEFEVDKFYDIIYQGHPYMIAPLSYRGLFKWINNQEGTPGYVLVDKYTGDRQLITNINGQDLKQKYMPSAYFGKDLHRYLYQNGYRHERLSYYSFEINEEGMPYWVVIETSFTINVNGGKDVNRVILVNAVTGEINDYKPEDTPNWVENIYLKDLVLEQLGYWGALKNGFWNSIIGQKGVVHTTHGSRRIYNDDKIYHYTGLTSVGGDESSTGFVYVNTKTKAAHLYSIVGATEEAAMKSAEGQVNNFAGYNATFPVSLNVNNQPTFFITIKDANGIIKKYTFVNIKDYYKVGLGDTITGAYNSYLISLGEDGDITDNSDLTLVTGVVERINWNLIEGNTIYYIKLEDDETIYQVKSNISDKLPITIVGDNLTIKVTGNIIKVFENDSI